MTFGLIGFGRLGQLLARHFSREVQISVFDVKLDARKAQELGVQPQTLAQVCAQDVIVVCVPIAEFEGVMKRIKSLVRPDALVVDVCSVKEHPVRMMKKYLPKSVSLLATHPNFGPDSAGDSLQGRKIILCQVRMDDERYQQAKEKLISKGLEVVELTPREHDRRMASSLLLTHFIGRSLIAFGAKPTGMDTNGYKRLLQILETVQNDSWQLFQDMNRYNVFAPAMRRRFLAALQETDRKVKK